MMPGLWFDSGVTAILQRALDAASLRQSVIANNIANADTPGYVAQTVDFEQALHKALARGPGQAGLRLAVTNPAHLGGAGVDGGLPEPRVVVAATGRMRNDGNTVDVDAEMANLAKNTIAYNALTSELAARLAMWRTVIEEGRR